MGMRTCLGSTVTVGAVLRTWLVTTLITVSLGLTTAFLLVVPWGEEHWLGAIATCTLLKATVE